MALSNSWGILFNLLVMLICLSLLSHYWRDKKIVDKYSASIIKNLEDPTEQALALCAAIYKLRKSFPPDLPDPHFIPFGGLSALGASPAAVLRNGGCCSGLTRLAIVGLHSLGFKAWQTTLYHKSGDARHCLLEVAIGTEKLLIDPTYGFYYVDSTGAPLSLLALREGRSFSFVYLPGINRDHYYPQNEYYSFEYLNTKTINWTKSPLRKACYHFLCPATKGTIDRVNLPSFLEWPQLALVCLLCCMWLVLASLRVISLL